MSTVSQCPAERCTRRQEVKGWCSMHYKRLRRRGTTHDITAEERFFAKVEQVGDCWIWRATIQVGGYGRFGLSHTQPVLAHRWAYEFLRTEIPAGLHLDHLCRTPACVNPWHLEPVTARVNLRRSNNPVGINARKTECVNGHAFDAENTYVTPDGPRQCRACLRIRAQRK